MLDYMAGCIKLRIRFIAGLSGDYCEENNFEYHYILDGTINLGQHSNLISQLALIDLLDYSVSFKVMKDIPKGQS